MSTVISSASGCARGTILAALLVLGLAFSIGRAEKPPAESADQFSKVIQPLVKQYCLECHSTRVKKGDLDLQRFESGDHVRRDTKPWQAVLEMLEAGEMPPKDKPKPTADERRRLIVWTKATLDAQARAMAGDPGRVPLRRLSNAEYDATIRDLTGVDLRPAREFPADGAAGEGFTNAAEALAEISPTLLGKYLNASKEIAAHAILLPDGFRFSATRTRRDWTDESLAAIRGVYANYTADGKLPLRPYLAAAVRHRDAMAAGQTTAEAVATKEGLNAKYLGILWRALTDPAQPFPLDRLRLRFRQAAEKDVDGLLAEIAAWQAALWKFVPIGSYRDRNMHRQVANDPAIVPAQTLRLSAKPTPGQSEVTLYLSARDFSAGGPVVWSRPRLDGPGGPLLLRDYRQFGPKYEVDLPAIFAGTPRYLAAVAQGSGAKPEELARQHGLDAELLKRWIALLAVETESAGKPIRAAALEPLTDPLTQNPAIKGWKKPGTDLPVLVANSSDQVENIPGRVPPHRVAVHPTPQQFVAAAWKSPIEGRVRVSADVLHAHNACGNGVAFWLEHRRGDRAFALAEGAINVGKQARVPSHALTVAKGDLVILAVDARDANHSCDLTEINLTITEVDKPARTWELAGDISSSVAAGNPHADRLGNAGVWSFVAGPAKPAGYFAAGGPTLTPGSVLARWREPGADRGKLAEQVRALLTGPRPAQEKSPDRALYDNLVALDGPLLAGLDLSRFRSATPGPNRYGLPTERFGRRPADDASLLAAANEVIAIRLPAALLRDREFVVDGKLPGGTDRAVQFALTPTPPAANAVWDGNSPIVATPSARRDLLAGFTAFRDVFPTFICYPRIMPEDEVVCLKIYHREDEHLARLFLDGEQARRLDRLWAEHRFITQWPITEHKNLPLFIGFVTQDQPKELVVYFESLREPFRQRAEAFEREIEAAAPNQLEQLADFAAHAYRRPLRDAEKAELFGLYQAQRAKGIAHDEAFRTVLARVLVAPSFLFHVEQAPPGKQAGPVGDWELASRLSYFLWSSPPDEELRRVAAEGRLRDPDVLAAQTQRMLKDGRTRALGIEFGTQWVHVRGFDELKEKNEKLFPTFDDSLRRAIYEESILFFQHLFQNDRPITDVLDADYTFLNETLAKHYGIPGVSGPLWRRVEGVRKYGRGGVLGLASVQTKEAGASRTSPVLRGNWVVETLLGEKLPRPPANVPRLPEEEGGTDGLTMRQLVEKHTHAPECAVCHVRIDAFGFALERYDPIGRLRDKDFGGLPLDSHAKLKDGTTFEGIDGLRNYLLAKKKDVIVRLLCRKLVGYALGRATTLADQSLIDAMIAELNKNDGRLTAAVLTVVRSPQFRMIRGAEFEDLP